MNGTTFATSDFPSSQVSMLPVRLLEDGFRIANSRLPWFIDTLIVQSPPVPRTITAVRSPAWYSPACSRPSRSGRLRTMSTVMFVTRIVGAIPSNSTQPHPRHLIPPGPSRFASRLATRRSPSSNDCGMSVHGSKPRGTSAATPAVVGAGVPGVEESHPARASATPATATITPMPRAMRSPSSGYGGASAPHKPVVKLSRNDSKQSTVLALTRSDGSVRDSVDVRIRKFAGTRSAELGFLHLPHGVSGQ